MSRRFSVTNVAFSPLRCPNCERLRDLEMSRDHEFERLAAGDPANDRTVKEATDREYAEWLSSQAAR